MGIAAAKVSEPVKISHIENDFNQINQILSSLVDKGHDNRCSIWPFLRKMLSRSGKIDNSIVDFSMKIASDGAWKFATDIAQRHQSDKPAQIVTCLGKWIQFIIWIIRMTEKETVIEKIEN